MSEFDVRGPEFTQMAMRQSENLVEEEWRESTLAPLLFHDNHLNQSIPDSFEQNLIQTIQLEMDFLHDKKGLNMGERFDLALSSKYLGKIHVVELGHSTDPGANGEVDGLKKQYHQFLKWMNENDITAIEKRREDSGREISIRRPALEEFADKYVVMVRNRPLIDTEVVYEGKNLRIGILKRMVFSLPKQSLKPLLAISKNLNDERVQRTIEERFLENGWGGVVPIRTTYYLATDILP